MSLQLSIVLPAFNCKDLAEKNVAVLDKYLASWCPSYEVIVVDDGSAPKECISSAVLPSSARIIRLRTNTGKGAAVQTGMLAATGGIRIFTDIDLPYDLAAIRYAVRIMKDNNFPYVAGDRTLPVSHYVIPGNWARKIASKIFSKLVTLLIIGGIYDSQCGFKAFSAPLAEALFPLLTIKRFSFDVEIYYLLLKYNIIIRRIPVRLKSRESSTVNLLRDALPMACQTFSIPFKWYAGEYRSDAMNFFLDPPYWEE